MTGLLCVGAGGALGAMGRYSLGLIPLGGELPLMTLLINFRHLVYGLSMLEKFSRFFNVGRNIDAAVRYQKIRQFFLHFSTCSIYIQHWNYDSIFPGNAFDKRNRFL
mgnify:CR=1 FL=1